MTVIIHYERAFFYTVADCFVYFRATLSACSSHLIVCIKINLVDNNISAPFTDVIRQIFRIGDKIIRLIVTYQCDDITPVCHRTGIFSYISLDFVDDFRSLFLCLHRHSSNRQVYHRGVGAVFRRFHQTFVIVKADIEIIGNDRRRNVTAVKRLPCRDETFIGVMAVIRRVTEKQHIFKAMLITAVLVKHPDKIPYTCDILSATRELIIYILRLNDLNNIIVKLSMDIFQTFSMRLEFRMRNNKVIDIPHGMQVLIPDHAVKCRGLESASLKCDEFVIHITINLERQCRRRHFRFHPRRIDRVGDIPHHLHIRCVLQIILINHSGTAAFRITERHNISAQLEITPDIQGDIIHPCHRRCHRPVVCRRYVYRAACNSKSRRA